MISNKSAKNYLYYNGLILFLSLLQYNAVQISNQILFDLFKIYAVFLARNYFLMALINDGIKNKKQITHNHNHNPVIESYPNEFNFNVARATAVETATYYSIATIMSNYFIPFEFQNMLYFIPLTFYYELVFDFFHYWSHRLLHTNKFLYVIIHKHHHKYNHPTPIITFYQEPLDLILTNSIPTILTLVLSPRMSLVDFNIIMMYKTHLEICGHCGKYVYPTSSFCQCIWLPRYFGIELYSEDHDIHHSRNNCNYSKRFSFWDKVFGTYVPAYPYPKVKVKPM